MSNFTVKTPVVPVDSFVEGDSVVLHFDTPEEAAMFHAAVAKVISDSLWARL